MRANQHLGWISDGDMVKPNRTVNEIDPVEHSGNVKDEPASSSSRGLCNSDVDLTANQASQAGQEVTLEDTAVTDDIGWTGSTEQSVE